MGLREPGGWGHRGPKPAIEVTTDFFAGKGAAKCSVSACEPYRETILGELSRGRNAMGIWQDLVDRHGFAGGYQSVKRLVRKLRGVSSPEARVVIETAAGVSQVLTDELAQPETFVQLADQQQASVGGDL